MPFFSTCFDKPTAGGAAGRCGRFGLLGAAALALLASVDALALEWRLELEGVAAGGAQADRLSVDRISDGTVRAALEQLAVPGLGALGSYFLDCPQAAAPCRDGTIERKAADREAGPLVRWRHDGDRLRVFAGEEESARATIRRTPSDWTVEFDRFGVADWIGGGGADVDLQSALISGSASLAGEGGAFDLQLQALDFDTRDGRSAGAGLALGLDGRWSGSSVDATLVWTAGEALFGPVYLPSPPTPIRLELRHRSGDAAAARVEVRIDAEPVLAGEASATWDGEVLAGRPRRLQGRLEVASLAALWPLGLESLAAEAGWPALQVDGRFSGSLDWQDGSVQQLQLALDEVAVVDPAGRLALEGLSTDVERTTGGDRIELAFAQATVYRLPFGSTRVSLAGSNVQGAGLSLTEAARIPLLDGALRIDRLELRSGDGEGDGPGLALDAEIEPLSLAALTERLGWPRFGGRLSGRFPGLEFERDVFRVAGGLDLELFDGTARFTDLAIERPFGPLTALTGTLTFDRLDLDPLTSAFDFGAMQGSLSGYLRDVRLLDWQPVAFDAWFHTPDDSRRPRRISQRAVDQIASLGGGGAAALSAPLLSLFDDFGYTRVGLGCRLAQYVCTMRGLEEMDSGGYRIVEGRGLPRLDVVGFRRRVDWPVLLAQLEAATRSDGPSTGD
jgi:hypothetical protein